MLRLASLLCTGLVLLATVPPTESRAEEPWHLLARSIPFDDSSAGQPITYVPLDQASRPWKLCVIYPHLKDAYWLSVNFGMVEEAQRLGVSFILHEAGGYPNLGRQIDFVRNCVESAADALILGTVSFGGLTPAIAEAARHMPVMAAVNDIDDRGITAKASVPWREMGAAAGRVIAERHPEGSPPVRVAWFPGPKGAGWVSFVEQGFLEVIADSSAEIVVTKYGDTGLEEQVLLVEEVIESTPDVDYLVGSGPMAEAAVSILRMQGLSDRIGIISTYMSHSVFRGIMRGRILAAPTDFPVLQGRLAVELAVRALEGKLETHHAGPAIVTVTSENIFQVGVAESLAPASFAPVFEVRALYGQGP